MYDKPFSVELFGTFPVRRTIRATLDGWPRYHAAVRRPLSARAAGVTLTTTTTKIRHSSKYEMLFFLFGVVDSVLPGPLHHLRVCLADPNYCGSQGTKIS